jgi:DNA-binding GntR family transcriptional regulator
MLAQQMGMSRMPVRDALRMLENDNLIETFPTRGISFLISAKSWRTFVSAQILEGNAVEFSKQTSRRG